MYDVPNLEWIQSRTYHLQGNVLQGKCLDLRKEAYDNLSSLRTL